MMSPYVWWVYDNRFDFVDDLIIASNSEAGFVMPKRSKYVYLGNGKAESIFSKKVNLRKENEDRELYAKYQSEFVEKVKRINFDFIIDLGERSQDGIIDLICKLKKKYPTEFERHKIELFVLDGRQNSEGVRFIPSTKYTYCERNEWFLSITMSGLSPKVKREKYDRILFDSHDNEDSPCFLMDDEEIVAGLFSSKDLYNFACKTKELKPILKAIGGNLLFGYEKIFNRAYSFFVFRVDFLSDKAKYHPLFNNRDVKNYCLRMKESAEASASSVRFFELSKSAYHRIYLNCDKVDAMTPYVDEINRVLALNGSTDICAKVIPASECSAPEVKSFLTFKAEEALNRLRPGRKVNYRTIVGQLKALLSVTQFPKRSINPFDHLIFDGLGLVVGEIVSEPNKDGETN